MKSYPVFMDVFKHLGDENPRVITMVARGRTADEAQKSLTASFADNPNLLPAHEEYYIWDVSEEDELKEGA